jgi:hypothetical protein
MYYYPWCVINLDSVARLEVVRSQFWILVPHWTVGRFSQLYLQFFSLSHWVLMILMLHHEGDSYSTAVICRVCVIPFWFYPSVLGIQSQFLIDRSHLCFMLYILCVCAWSRLALRCSYTVGLVHDHDLVLVARPRLMGHLVTVPVGHADLGNPSPGMGFPGSEWPLANGLGV